MDYDDVIKKMIVTVELLNRERSNVINVNNSYEECKKKLKDDYENQLLQKEEKVNKEMKDYNDKVCRLQMDNKQLRDKIMLYELKVSNDQSHRDIQNSE